MDCSNWGVSASWTVPTTLVSGVYFAHIFRTDGTSDENQIPFVVRDDASHSDILFKTDDETWQAYNDWGGYSLYTGNATDTTNRPTSLDPGRAEQVSYDRPFDTRFDTPYGQDYFFYAEFPMIEFLEENGYNVSYIDQGTVASPQGASLIEQHKVLMAAGHDEYWTAAGGGQRHRGQERRRQHGVLHRQRGVLGDAVGAGRRGGERPDADHVQGEPGQRARPIRTARRPGLARGTTRDLARPATAASRRTR